MASQRTLTPLFVLLATATVPLLSSTGCEEKMKVQKRAEEMSASASAKVAESASAAPSVDPKEKEFAKSRKDVHDRAVAFMTALQKLYVPGSGEPERAAFKAFYVSAAPAQKEAEDISKEALYAAKQGMSIKHFDVQEAEVDQAMTSGTVGIFEEQSQRGIPRCLLYKISWKKEGETWKRETRLPARAVDCTMAKDTANP